MSISWYLHMFYTKVYDFNLEKNDLMRNQAGFEPTTLRSWATRSAIWATAIR